MLNELLPSVRDYLFYPQRAVQNTHKPQALIVAFLIYAAATLGTICFYALKPAGFPDVYSPVAHSSQGLSFWIQVMLWQMPLEAAWLAFLLGLAGWLGEGRLVWRLASSVLWTAAAFMFPLAQSQHMLTRAALAAGAAGWIGLFYPALKKIDSASWRPMITFMIGINAVGLLLLLPMTAATLTTSPMMFKAVQIAGGIWMLGLATLGLRRLYNMRMPRAFMAVLLSIALQTALALTLHQLGLIPKEIFKALLYA